MRSKFDHQTLKFTKNSPDLDAGLINRFVNLQNFLGKKFFRQKDDIFEKIIWKTCSKRKDFKRVNCLSSKLELKN